MTPAAPAMPWSSAQLAWLQAMGYTVYTDGAVAAEQAAVAPSIDLQVAAPAPRAVETPMPQRVEAPSAAPAHAGSGGEPLRRGRAPEVPDTRATGSRAAPASAAPRAARSGRRRGPLPDRLLMALLRASGCNPESPETQALMQQWPLDELRGNAAAKRALWPSLRALRRKARQ